MPSEILLIQHTDTTTPGLTLPWLQKRGSFRHLKIHHGEELPPPNKSRAIILCGGAPHVDEETKYPWLKPEKKFLEESFKAGSKVLGLCLGGQLCAQVLGAKVYAHPRGWEIGWWDVHLHATQNLVGFESNQTLTVSQHHRYIFEAPQDSQLVASNSWWKTQAFLWNNQVLAFQFHPERDLPGNKISSTEEDPCAEGQTQKASEIVRLGNIHQPGAAKWFNSVLNGFFV